MSRLETVRIILLYFPSLNAHGFPLSMAASTSDQKKSYHSNHSWAPSHKSKRPRLLPEHQPMGALQPWEEDSWCQMNQWKCLFIPVTSQPWKVEWLLPFRPYALLTALIDTSRTPLEGWHGTHPNTIGWSRVKVHVSKMNAGKLWNSVVLHLIVAYLLNGVILL